MLSNKWTFSLTSLVVMLALAFVVPSAMAAEFTVVTLSVGPDVDISSPDGIQAAYGGMLLTLRLPRVQWCNLLLPRGIAAGDAYCSSSRESSDDT